MNSDEKQNEQQNRDRKNRGDFSCLDRWILSRLSRMVETVNDAFVDGNFHKAVTAIRQFIYYEFCDLYVVRSFKLLHCKSHKSWLLSTL